MRILKRKSSLSFPLQTSHFPMSKKWEAVHRHLCGGEVLGEEFHRGVVGGVLVDVVEGLERQQGVGLCVAATLECVGDKPVGELGILGQRRAMQVRADDALVDEAFKAIVAVVAVPATTDVPSGVASASKSVRPPWFSNPTKGSGARSVLTATLPIRRSEPRTVSAAMIPMPSMRFSPI